MKLVWEKGQEISNDIIIESEKKINYVIPSSIKDVVLRHDGAMLRIENEGNLDYAYVDVKNIGQVSIQLKRHRVLENYSNSEFVNDFNLYQENLPLGFIAFAHDAGDNIYIVDLTQTDDTSKIYYLSIEESVCRDDLENEGFTHKEVEEQLKKSLIYVADSFGDLMMSLGVQLTGSQFL